MAIGIQALIDAAASHASASGHFERVQGHEPKSAPGNGLHCAVWVQDIGPVPLGSGLASTTARVVLMVRLYANMLREPQDGIDPALVGATDALLAAYSGDFDLGGNVRNVDLLGAHGEPLSAKAGYLNQDNRLYRVIDIVLPLIVNDVWDQGA